VDRLIVRRGAVNTHAFKCGEILLKLESFEKLEKYLREFNSFTGDSGEYDFGGAAALMLATLNNLREKALPAELENLPESLTEDESQFILQLADYVQQHRNTKG
jgi:hypothetical protein